MTNPAGRRRAIVAFFLSSVFPGLGQFYNHQALKGGAFLIAGIALSWLIGRVVPTDLMALASASVGTDAILLLSLLLAIWALVGHRRVARRDALNRNQWVPAIAKPRRSTSSFASLAGSTGTRLRIRLATAFSSPSSFGSSGSPPRLRPTAARTTPSFR